MIGEAEDTMRFRAGILAGLLLAAAGAADPSMPEKMLAAHNAARAAVKTRPLVWSERLAVLAQDWANLQITRQGGLIHQKKSKYGENLYESIGGPATPEEVVKRWTSEAVDFDYKTNHCLAVCGHYTQVIWRDTKEVGCGVARHGNREIWVCEYSPPGNYVGERPY